MESIAASHDPYQPPPEDMKFAFKEWRKFTDGSSLKTTDVTSATEWTMSEPLKIEVYESIIKDFLNHKDITRTYEEPQTPTNAGVTPSCYESTIIPGLQVFPSFLPPECQTALLDRLINRDLSNPAHQTNLNLHYDIQHPKFGKSFLNYDRNFVPFTAKDPAVHPDITMEKAMRSKLRWITLGGQYDWTRKIYPEEKPPAFPEDICHLLHGAFPEMKPQAAIVNFYSPGDTLSIHRDVSEEIDRGLVSVSIGCDALFMIGVPRDDDASSYYQVLRLRSGDAVFMSGKSRYAWHGVPKVIPNTCPEFLLDWPGSSYPQWREYMRTKRINLNVRQMNDDPA